MRGRRGIPVVVTAVGTGKPEHRVRIAVAGAHLSGQPLNHELTARGARLTAATTTAAAYRLFLLDVSPAKPGLVRVTYGGVPIEVEVWELSAAGFGTFVAGIAAPMAIARIELTGGDQVCGFSCEPVALERAVDISGYGGWRAFCAAAAR